MNQFLFAKAFTRKRSQLLPKLLSEKKPFFYQKRISDGRNNSCSLGTPLGFNIQLLMQTVNAPEEETEQA